MGSTGMDLVYTVLGGTFVIAVVAIVGGFLHYRRERTLTHTERMKALELGREMPDGAATARIKAAFGATSSGDKEEESGSLSSKCYSTALWVAFWGFMAAGPAGAANSSVAIAIAASVGAIGVTGFICGTILAARSPAGTAATFAPKQRVDADAFDVASRRG